MPAAKILIVDDDLEIRQLLGEELRDMGHESLYAADGVQAMSLVRRERPDLVLLDLMLPAGDGFCVLERLQRIPEVAYTPVIVFSGMRSPDVEERALMLGAREFVHKSFSGDNLTEAIARVLEPGLAPDASRLPQFLSPPPLSAGATPDAALPMPALRRPALRPAQSYGG
jgi:DNA-binding response OmpR family regulator